MADSLYEKDGDVYTPTGYVRGPWSYDHCHGGPPAGRLTTAILNQRPEMAMTRVTVDIPGPIPIAPVRVETEVLRPGKKITHVAASLVGLDGVRYASAAGWLMRTTEDGFPATERSGSVPTTVEDSTPVALNFWGDDPEFSDAIELKAAEGTPFAGGPATAWVKVLVPIVAGEPTHPAAMAATVSDLQNGIAALAHFTELVCANTDVTVYFARNPVGDWISLNSKTNSSGLGLGMTDSLLYDASGFVGTANQSIFFDSLHPQGTRT